jgi:hypothetical protein
MLAKDLQKLSDEELYRKRSEAASGSLVGDQLDVEIKRRQDFAGRASQRFKARLDIVLAAISLIALIVACLSYFEKIHSQAPATIEAQRIVLRDSKGNIVAWIGSAPLADGVTAGMRPNVDLPLATVASGEVSGLFIFSKGKVSGSIIPTAEGAVFDIKGDGDALTHITGDGLELLGRSGHLAADLKSWPSPFFDLHDQSGKVAWSSIGLKK